MNLRNKQNLVTWWQLNITGWYLWIRAKKIKNNGYWKETNVQCTVVMVTSDWFWVSDVGLLSDDHWAGYFCFGIGNSGREQSHPTSNFTSYAKALIPKVSTTWFMRPLIYKSPERQLKQFRIKTGISKQGTRQRLSKGYKCMTNFTLVGWTLC